MKNDIFTNLQGKHSSYRALDPGSPRINTYNLQRELLSGAA